MLWIISGGFAGGYRAPDRVLDTPPLAVAEVRQEIARAPVLGAMLVEPFQAFKAVVSEGG
jgi:hypothetical protein